MDSKNKLYDIRVSTKAAMPIYEQIKQEIKLEIIAGNLKPDDQLPPIREFASRLKVNPNTIVKVYYQLDVEGYIYSQPGSGYFVLPDRRENPAEKKDLFEQVTNDYLFKVLKLGFSAEKILQEIKKNLNKGGKK